MPLTPGLSPNIREIGQPPMPGSAPHDDIAVEVQDNDGTTPEFDDSGAILRIEHRDGSVTLTLDGRPLEEAKSDAGNGGWFGNLVDKIGQGELGRISSDLLRGIEDDLDSRREWVEERAQGIRLMGLRVNVPGVQGAVDGAPVEGMSRVNHPLLQEAVLRFQANARSELLPTDGPIKIRNDNNDAQVDEDRIANALEKDLNHYLTSTASEYYPDTDRMLLMLGFGGTAFKKVYFCPLRNRPVSESVDADDLIVNNAATDLKNAKRVTHRLMMNSSTVRRMQILGVYKDISLHTADQPKEDAVREEKKAQQGVSPNNYRPEDRYREIYECYCELDVVGFEHRHKGKDSGLEIPYRVTIDVSSREILSIVRNYDEDDKELPTAKQSIVKYTFVPGFGFYDVGLLNILGNTTNAATAAWREMLDAGMYANFPGFLIADIGARQNTSIMRVPPGGGAQIKTGGNQLKDMILPLPYKDITSGLMNLVENIVATGQRVGGTAEVAVGEGKQDAPVGTTLALIDGATKILNSVHKRLHAAQTEEFRLLVECFKENPESFWQKNRTPAYPWDEQTFLTALEDNELTPQADPNTSSSTQRYMKVWALMQLQAALPQIYDPIKIHTMAIQALGFGNPEQFFAPVDAMGQPTPQAQKMISEAQFKDADAKARMQMAGAHEKMADAKMVAAKADMMKAGHGPEGEQGPTTIDAYDAQTKRMDAETKRRGLDVQARDTALKAQQQAKDRQSEDQIAQMDLQKEVLIHKDKMASEQMQMQHEHAARQQEMMHSAAQAHQDRAVQAQQSERDRALQAQESETQRMHSAEQSDADRKFQIKTAAMKPKPTGRK